jgi:hypothetical protein
MRFGDDWTGLFLRGDNAMYYAQMLRMILPPQPTSLAEMTVWGLVRLLEGTDERGVLKSPQMLKPYADCLP